MSKITSKCVVAFIVGVAFSNATAQAQSDEAVPGLAPEVIEILSDAAEFLASQETMSVNWFVSYDTVIDGREKITETRSGSNLLSRGEGFYSFAEQGLNTREYYFDGASFHIVDVEEDAYVLAPFNGDFEALVERAQEEYGVVLPIWSIMSRQAQGELLDGAESAVYLGMTRIAGQKAHHLALSDYESDWQVWISTDANQPELLMLVGTNPYEQGWPQYRAFFTGWDFSPDVPDGAFSYTPGENSSRMTWPKVESPLASTALDATSNAENE